MNRKTINNKIYYDREKNNVPKIELMIENQNILLENLQKNRSLFEYIDCNDIDKILGTS
jgi:hypothetical protein